MSVVAEVLGQLIHHALRQQVSVERLEVVVAVAEEVLAKEVVVQVAWTVKPAASLVALMIRTNQLSK